MSNLPISSKYRSRPDAPVTDAERDEVVARVNEAYVARGIPAEDYEALLDRAYAATTLGELGPVVEGLPALRTHEEPVMVAQGPGRPGGLSPGGMSQRTMARVMTGVAAGSAVLVLLVVLLAATGALG